MSIDFSNDELVMLNNCLNEICNGAHIEDWEFHSRVGWLRSEVQVLLNKIRISLPRDAL
jgi:hypothetical protein